MVPIRIVYSEVRPSPVITISATRKSDFRATPSFYSFFTAITRHLAAKLAQEELCLGSAESKERSLIQFVYMPLAVPTANPSLSPAKFPGVCRISSPWIDIAVEREPVPSVRAIVRFNERQLLADQAVLAGARDVPPGAAVPLTDDEFRRYLSEYPKPGAVYVDADGNVREKAIGELIPSDFLWLLNRIQGGGMTPFSGVVVGAMGGAMYDSAEGYTKIVTSLIDRCFEFDGGDMHYDSILDVADFVPLEQYRSAMPLIKNWGR
jgi:hypothetical protein